MKAQVQPEFPRRVSLDELDAGEVRRTVEADENERAALAGRFDLIAIDALGADVRLRRISGGPLVRVAGRLTADVVQRCVVTLAPVPVHIEEDFVETFGPPGYRLPEEETDADLPEVFDDDGIDLGELAAQLLLLSLNPYPRAAGAEAMQQAGPEGGGDRVRPFAGLGEMMQKRRK